MKPLDIWIIIIVCGLVFLAVRNMVKRKKSGCGCGCCSCKKDYCHTKK